MELKNMNIRNYFANNDDNQMIETIEKFKKNHSNDTENKIKNQLKSFKKSQRTKKNDRAIKMSLSKKKR